jgi:GT2 family glycosyltransferase/glycosyltransferase involved in cell wall biosynthesis
VIIANYNGERFLRDALASACNQTLRAIEILVIDDASSDTSVEIANKLAAEDARIRVISRETRSGPGAARNDGIAAARGQWIAVLDSDDMMHPSRLADLVREAELWNADICADDLLIFQDGAPPSSHLSPHQRKLGWVTAADFVDRIYGREPSLGYLKPLISTAFLRTHGIRYEPELLIGEDYNLILKLLAKGAKFRLLDTLTYFYRKHGNSISHRLTSANLERMLIADEQLRTQFPENANDVARSFRARRTSIEGAIAYADIISALKARKWREAGTVALRNPRAVPLLAMPVAARLQRLLPHRKRTTADDGNDKRICLISRQRLIGCTNGSSTYLIALAGALRDAGHRITLISPSVATLGRWPFLRLRPEMAVFDEVHIRGALRIGDRLRVAIDPRIALSAASAIAARLASRLGLHMSSWDKPAPYAIAEPWRREDQLYIAQHAPPNAWIVLADYAFTTPAIPYALLPSARSAVIMHDFFSARTERFREQQLSDSVAALDQASELRLLAQADAIIAIQTHEAEAIQRLLPDRRVILASHACRTVAAPQAGDPRTLLFVGSNTAPNVVALRWFLAEIWPEIRRSVTDCELKVAGSVTANFVNNMPGVQFLGIVPDLDPLYAQAGVVISPLTVGSGLKIKLIEALGQGKAIVATSISTEGCENAVVEAILQRDDAREFAEAVVQLLSDDALRRNKAAQALDVAQRLYSHAASYSELLQFAAGGEKADSNLDARCATPKQAIERCVDAR